MRCGNVIQLWCLAFYRRTKRVVIRLALRQAPWERSDLSRMTRYIPFVTLYVYLCFLELMCPLPCSMWYTVHGSISLWCHLSELVCNVYANWMIIPDGFKLCRHLCEPVAMCVEVRVSFERFFPILRILLGTPMFHLDMTLKLSLPIFKNLFCTLLNPNVRSQQSFYLWFSIHWCKPVPKVVHMCLWSTKGFLDLFVTKIWNALFVWASDKLCAGISPHIRLAPHIRSTAIIPHVDAMRNPGDSVSCRIMMTFTAGTVVCLSC